MSRRHSVLAWVAALSALAACAPVAAAQTPLKPAPAKQTRAPGASASAALPASGGYTVEPAPSWVIPPPADAAAAGLVPAPMSYRLIDDQTRVSAKADERYTRVVRVVGDSSGLAAAAQVEIEFDPTFQSLALHQIDVVRGGVRSTRLDRKRVQLLQREANLERRMYDGRVTFSLVLEDVRVGDDVEIAYTLRGANPVFSGRFVAAEWMTSAKGPVAFYRERLLAPPARNIAVRPGMADVAVTKRMLGELQETTAIARMVPVWRPDPGASSQVVLDHQVLESEYADWGDVATWGRTLFVEPSGATPLLDRKAAELADGKADAPAKVLAALDFVQKDVRYFGTEIGPSTHRPAAPEQVLQQRFGDCKDKVSLFLALLRRMGVDGEPVLVSTVFRGKVAQMLPTPLAFDHVIARVPLDGKTYWLDATRAQQTGTLGARQSLGFSKGLALGPGTAPLVTQPSVLSTRRLDVDDRFIVDDFTQPVVLESRITLRGDFAEGVRDSIANAGIEATSARFSGAYVRLYPKLKTLQPVVVEPVPDDDAVVLVQRFSLPEFWRFPEQRALVGEMASWAIADALRVPQTEARHDPYGFALPGIYTQHVSIKYPIEVFDKTASNDFDDDGDYIAMHVHIQQSKDGLQVATEATLKTDELPAAQWAAYDAQLRKDFPRLILAATVSPVPVAKVPALQAEFKTLADSLRNGRARPKTKVQAEAPLKALLLTYEIDGGRLDSRLLAQALTQRGIQRDQLARLDQAGQDFDRSLQLAPEAKETLNAAAVNALLRGNSGRSIELSDAVLKQSAKDAEALNTRALSKYLAGDYAGARDDLATMLESQASWRRGYPVVTWMLVQRRLGTSSAAPGRADHESELPTDWPRPLVDWAEGRSDTDALLRAANSVPMPAERLCEAYFYIGERFQAEGDAARANDYFRKTVDLGIVEYMEDGLAHLRLAAAGIK